MILICQPKLTTDVAPCFVLRASILHNQDFFGAEQMECRFLKQLRMCHYLDVCMLFILAVTLADKSVPNDVNAIRKAVTSRPAIHVMPPVHATKGTGIYGMLILSFQSTKTSPWLNWIHHFLNKDFAFLHITYFLTYLLTRQYLKNI
jgi:hypothetical protein